jgi:hypothetical protein
MQTFKIEPIVRDMSSDSYHGLEGTYSSSQLKDLLDDPEYFHKKYIAKSIQRENLAAFDIGTYFHTAILEPHKLKDECAIFSGIRRGASWDKFREENSGKAIITESEMSQALSLINAVKSSPIAMNRIKRGEPEVSSFIELAVQNGTIFAPEYKKQLGPFGWETTKSKITKDAIKLIIKVRADLLGSDFVLDLKSTNGNTKSSLLMRRKISDFQYDLSAALYLDIFSLTTGNLIKEFVWVFASKDMGNCKSYLASEDNIRVGRAKWKKAILTLAGCISSQWRFDDSMGVLEPMPYELEHLKLRAEDIL